MQCHDMRRYKMQAPKITESTREEREYYIRKNYRCRANCEGCELCHMFHAKEPVEAFAEYIEGKKSFEEILAYYGLSNESANK